MISAFQAQQANQAAITVSTGFATSCTPHLPDYRWHVHFGDFEKICGHEVSADALRAFEMMTNARIARLRESASIPDGTLPHENDLWIEASAPDVDFWTLHVQDQSTYSFCLREKTEPNRAKSLLELGFLRRRFVAYPGRYAVAPVATTVYLDVLGNSFIIVDDDKQGYYVGVDGELHSAADEGYTVMRRQYLYCIEAINAALAKLAGQSPPAPMKRWHSLQRKALTSETTKSTASQGQSTTSQQTTAAQGCLDDEIKGKRPGQTLLFANKNNTVDGRLSLENAENRMSVEKLSNNSVPLRSPWSPETCVALSAQINHELFVLSAHIDEEVYNRDWLEPAQRLIEKRCTDFAEPSRAWERVELHIWAMLIGQTWYAQGRTKKTPFSLRNVESNWDTVETELRKGSWPNYEHIEYTGPSLFDEQPAQSSYAQGYSAQSAMAAQPEEPTAQSDAQSLEAAHYVESTAQVLEATAQTEPVVEVVASEKCAADQVSSAQSMEAAQTEQSIKVTQGYSLRKARILAAQIREEHPEVGVRLGRSGVDLYLVGIEIALNAWVRIARPIDYYAITQEIADAIDQAEHYAGQRKAAQSNDGHADSQGPPGYGEVSEGGDE